jgi:serine/threonine protein kinase
VSSDKYVGQVLDNKYQIIELLGKGGMGAVYKGRHVVIGKTVAVKFLHQEFAKNKEVVQRFYREAQAAAAIGHGSIIDVMDVGISPDNEPYLVMEYLEGENLGSMLQRAGPLGIEAACGVMEPVLLALQAAHQKGIIHRDLKPDNIFLVHRESESPKVKLIDFGSSKFSEGLQGEKLTQTGSVMGTPAYMSPEQARGESDLDHRSDVYSMGVILYEMLTGKLPFSGDNFTAIIIKILTADPLPPGQAFAAFPQEAEAMLLRSLVKNPAGRYQTAIEFLEALKQVDGYSERRERLTQVAAGITSKTFAGGNLGIDLSNSDGEFVASDVLSEVMGGVTPTGWAGTSPQNVKKRSILLPLGIVATIVVVVGVLAGVLLFNRGTGQEPIVVPAATPAVPEDHRASATVEISVVGAPAGARISVDNSRVNENPFKVHKGEAIVPIRVEADGFEPFSISLTPSVNRVIQVALKPQKTGKERTAAGKRTSRKKRRGKTGSERREPSSSPPAITIKEKPQPETVVLPKPVPEAKKTEKKPAPEKKKTTVEGARGTKIKTTFE